VTVIGANMTAPFLTSLDSEGEPKGLTVDYLNALGAYLGEDIEIRVLPKFRIREQFERGEIDLNCYTNRKWAGDTSNKFQWSNKFFTVTDILVSTEGPVRNIDQARGAIVGTVLRYKYPGMFEDAVESGDIRREDVKSEDALLKMLGGHRIKYGVIAKPQLLYYLKQNPGVKINTSGLALAESEIRCWVLQGSALSLKRLNDAIEHLKSSGQLEEIFKKYR
jgi:ABC-type amino acid transport substrate-binding protein